jgi:hypothetical protein
MIERDEMGCYENVEVAAIFILFFSCKLCRYICNKGKVGILKIEAWIDAGKNENVKKETGFRKNHDCTTRMWLKCGISDYSVFIIVTYCTSNQSPAAMARN